MCMAVPIGCALASVWPTTELVQPLAGAVGGAASSGFVWAVHVMTMRLGADKL